MNETNKKEIEQARESLRALNGFSEKPTPKKAEALSNSVSLRKKSAGSGYEIRIVLASREKSERISLPEPAINALTKVLEHIADGDEVIVSGSPKEVSTQKAANFLHVSRPFLIGLLEKGVIPFHKVGTHRRIRFKDLLEYKSKIDAKRRSDLEELAKQAQELDMGY